MGRLAETQQVEAGDRPRAHGEHVAQNAADPGRRPLIGLDERGMVVAFHLEDASLPVANIDNAGVLSRPLNDPVRFGRQFAQVQPRRFIRAMLVPHGRENAEFGEGRDAADQFQNARIFIGFEPVSGDKLRRDDGFFGQGGPRSFAARAAARCCASAAPHGRIEPRRGTYGASSRKPNAQASRTNRKQANHWRQSGAGATGKKTMIEAVGHLSQINSAMICSAQVPHGMRRMNAPMKKN